MRSPWADHRGRVAGRSPKVIWTGSPVARFLIHTCGVPPASLTNAIMRPSVTEPASDAILQTSRSSSRPATCASCLDRVGPVRSVVRVRNCPDEHDRGNQRAGDNEAVGPGRGSLVRFLPETRVHAAGAGPGVELRSCRRRPNRGPCAAGDGPAGPRSFPSDERFGRCASGRTQSPSRNQERTPVGEVSACDGAFGGSRTHRRPEVRTHFSASAVVEVEDRRDQTKCVVIAAAAFVAARAEAHS